MTSQITWWQRPVYFPLVDHLVQELNDHDRGLSQENRLLGQYLVPAKLIAFNSGEQDKLYMKPTKPNFQRRDTLTTKF